MNCLDQIAYVMLNRGWFQEWGVYALVDGQYGSTGKGVAASLLEHVARMARVPRLVSATNAGPNSGHTAIYRGKKMLTQQLPISAIQHNWQGGDAIAYLNGGAIIDINMLAQEIEQYNMELKVLIHPNAAIIEEQDVMAEKEGSVAKIASTGKGVGSAISRKVLRQSNVAKTYENRLLQNIRVGAVGPMWMANAYTLMETAQGFSLGINQHFYPHCTSRECTVTQALSDLGAHPHHLRKTMMVVRTFPIRVGNTDKGHSGAHYADQKELTWEEVGQTPEMTTVTKRVRRIFTWSETQFRHALEANRPDAIFVNFCNYLKGAEVGPFLNRLWRVYRQEMGKEPDAIITGWSAETEGATLWPY